MNMKKQAKNIGLAVKTPVKNNTGRIRLGKNDKQLKEIAHKLTERVKELNYLYGISKLIETTGSSLDELLQGAVKLIPPAWQYPEITCARIQIKNKEMITANFNATKWKQEEKIFVKGEPYGKVEVYYLKKKPEADEGPFLKEERDLIHAIAERLGHIIERKLADDALQTLYMNEKELRKELEAEMNNRVDYTRGLIHELKTPLTSLLATSQLLHEEIKDNKLSRLSNYVWQNACNLNSRIDELHDVIRGEIGKLNLKLKPVDIENILVDIAEEAEILAQRCNKQLELKINSPLPKVYADGVRVKQILMNLLNNAFEYAIDDSLVQIIAAADNGSVIIEVHDQGPGINADEQQRIFDPYYSSSHKLQRSHGLGIGLALCKVLVEAQNGKIWVKSESGSGSSFFFTLQSHSRKNDSKSR
jgi:K+-sensing histidine kinase KdpD